MYLTRKSADLFANPSLSCSIRYLPIRVCTKFESIQSIKTYVNFARSKHCMIQILRNPNIARFKFCTIQILHDLNFARSKFCRIKIFLHDPNTYWKIQILRSKCCLIQSLPDPNIAQSKFCLIQILYHSNTAQSKFGMIQILHDPNCPIFVGLLQTW